ncbi:antibiotic biosynthesis monooxygenase family protein [Alkalilacustris brevis]|uniref:antibiotic biosynthesis monooxygenase family protein n=1 Tax=Alkalilacustris brevis TaxID=2026338 RepID=UPI000E0DC075|nr:antibiotic biosynthesis monooxygenase family protein [Alkalilacustris brevis]
MLRIDKRTEGQTVLTTFEVTPGTCEDLLEELRAAYHEVISHQPGFIAAALHVNDAQTRIANYSQWRHRDDFKAMLRHEDMRPRTRRFNELCKGFEPVMYEIAEVVDNG